MMTALYTVNLKIAGTNNVPLFSQETMFKNGMLESLFGETIPGYMKIVLILLVVLIAKFLLDFYLQTKSGYLLRAVGDNDNLVTALAKDKGNVKILGLAISNGWWLYPVVYLHRNRKYSIFQQVPAPWSSALPASSSEPACLRN